MGKHRPRHPQGPPSLLGLAPAVSVASNPAVVCALATAFAFVSALALALTLAFVSALALPGCASGRAPDSVLCGNGILERSETCDDGNDASGDGCDKQCKVEPGFSCDGSEPSGCTPVCGDGLVVGDETCDGSELGGRTCESLNLGGGTLVCGEDCQYDPSGCTVYSCGNGVRDEAEECDGSDFGEDSCLARDYDGGYLACSLLCVVDTSGCTLASCGNGIVEGIEGCDDGGTAPGDGCGANCSVEPDWECAGQPSVCTPLCGNGSLDPGEQCDGALLGGQDCTTIGLGYEGGTLSCAVTCLFNTSLCELPTCGNGSLATGEQCDGILLGGASCQSLGFLSGTLLCAPSCGYNTSSCIPHTCGDGVISGGEACDDNNQSSGDGCSLLCNVESGWICSGEPSVCTRLCGNGVINAGEQCDSANVGTASCESLGYDSGTLACLSSCQFDTSGCRYATCGDGHKDAGEDCDGADFGTATCQSLGFVSGMLQCTQNCGYNTSACVVPECGDGIISPSAGEQCDDDNTANADGCNSACQVELGWVCASEPSVCTPSCGNGVWNPGESCDGNDLHGGTCASLGFAGGALSCNPDCTYNTGACQASICPNGIKEGAEACDTNDFGGQTCASFGFAAGSLACDASCQILTSGCTNVIYSQSFDGGCPASWTLTGEFECGTPDTWYGPSSAHSGTKCLGTDLDDYYDTDNYWGDTTATSPNIDLTAATSPTVTWWMYVYTESCCDGANLKIKPSGGSWTLVSTVTPGYNEDAGSQSAWTGYSGTFQAQWYQFTADLTAWAGSIVQLRFDFYSDYSVEYDGVFVDDVVVSD